MVRQATATAVSASISTPVGPVTLTLARHRSLRGADAALLANERARRGLDIAFAHEAFTDEEGRNAHGHQVGEVGGRKNCTLANDDAAGRHPWRQASAGGERRLEGLEVAVIDADQP